MVKKIKESLMIVLGCNNFKMNILLSIYVRNIGYQCGKSCLYTEEGNQIHPILFFKQ